MVGRTLETLLGGRQVTRFEMNGEQYDVIVQLAAEDRASPGDAVDASSCARRPARWSSSPTSSRSAKTVAPKELRRFNQLRAVTISANLAPGYALGEALAFLEQTAREVLPSHVLTDVTGQSREFRAAGQSLALVFRAGARLHLSRAGGAVRELPRSADHPADGAAVDDGRAGRALADRRHAQRVLADRPRDAGRAHHQARHSDRRVRQPAAGRRAKTALEAVIEAAGLRLRPILMTTGGDGARRRAAGARQPAPARRAASRSAG